jgi:hypothetical protein
MNRFLRPLSLVLVLSLLARPALPFCGFYVAKADTNLFNRASQVVLARDGDRTVLTMANDFQGNPTEFAVVVPVPTFLTKEQIHVGDRALIDRLDAYSAPRLVEYHDADPCMVADEARAVRAEAPLALSGAMSRKNSLGVTVEARYTVGEYDILILSAKESAGLETWLKANGYRIPAGATSVLGSYIRQNLRFFVAKVNLKEQARLGFSYLRSIQVAYESPKFMLPIRLGMVNADGPQELFLYTLTRRGRVETTNYRTVRLPSDMDVPLFVKADFANFYRALFSEQVRRERMSAVFLEYAWNTSGCDPCAADPPSPDELRGLGVFWQATEAGAARSSDVFLTRLHIRYDRRHFPEDLVLQETADQTTFQGRFVLRHPYSGPISCGEETYRRELRRRHETEARNVASLTGWGIERIRNRMGLGMEVSQPKWYERIWNP